MLIGNPNERILERSCSPGTEGQVMPVNCAGTTADPQSVLSNIDAVDGITIRESFKFRQRRTDRDRKMLAAARGNPDIFTNDWRPSLGRYRHKTDPHPSSMPKYCKSARMLDILYPI